VCTLAVAFRADRRFPLVVAANRDERLGRAAEGWALRDADGGPRYAAPRDLVAGGTWMGVSARGVMAALTNYHAPASWYPDPARRSRGELVTRALAAASAADAHAAIRALDLARWNPFHLVVADGAGAFLVWYDGERSGSEELPSGLHVVTESDRDGRGPRAELVRARWPVDPSPDRLREVLTVHAPPAEPRAATCIHGDPAYGTRSSAILRLAPSLEASELLVAEGRPCVSPLEDRSDLLARLARGA
jgi:uncharacterized protein with NRDE domain